MHPTSARRAAILCCLLCGCLQPGRDLNPEQALESFELHPDFKIELVAAEPLVSDPIDMEIDESGRLYVLEMHGYPTDRSGTDRIKLLRDTDGDGRMDESRIFADSLVWPMGIMRWKNGLLVTEPPNVLYLEDSNGDGRADIERIILTGFDATDPESDVNNPTYGLDNWIYLANGPRSDSAIYFADDSSGPRIPVEATNRNIRFHPDRRALEAQSSRTQFGFGFDRWGRQLLVNNRDHIYQEVIASRYLERRPDLLVANATESISDHGAAAQVYPITEDPNPQLLTDIGEITAATGITFYDGGAFPAGFDSVSFVGEPAHNLVHADRLTDDGPTLVASRIRPHTEFLASTDSWFRPVNMYIGPDGALYIVDYYRQIIEGPAWLSEDVLRSGDLYNGWDKGRIYRITPKDGLPAEWTKGLDLGDVSSPALVQYLAHPNIWWRRNAQRLLMDRGDEAAVTALVGMARNDSSAVGRLHALWTLDGLGELDDSLIEAALRDTVTGVRENAIHLAERRLSDSAALNEALLAMNDDPSARVRFQLLLTLGFLDSQRAADVREELLFEAIGNKWVQIAALSAPSADERELLASVIDQYEPAYASYVTQLSAMVAANRPAEDAVRLLENATSQSRQESWQPHVLEGLALGLDARDAVPHEIRPELDGVLEAFFDHPSDSVRRASLEILKVAGIPPDGSGSAVDRAVDIAGDPSASTDRRAQSLELMRLGEPDQHIEFLKGLIVPDEPTAVQAAAVRTLGAATGPEVSRYVLDNWSVLTPDVRDAALETILSWPLKLNRITMILEAIADGTVRPAGIGWTHKVTLMRDIPDSLKMRARDLITSAEQAREAETVQYAADVKARDADPSTGRELFAQHCAQCHKLGDIADGSSFGPDLMSVRGWKPENIVAHVIRPNLSIAQGYDYWQVNLKSGETLQGIIASETANAVTLSRQGVTATVVPRQEIASLRDMNVSIMPGDFMERVSPQEMADLTSFIRTGH